MDHFKNMGEKELRDFIDSCILVVRRDGAAEEVMFRQELVDSMSFVDVFCDIIQCIARHEAGREQMIADRVAQRMGALLRDLGHIDMRDEAIRVKDEELADLRTSLSSLEYALCSLGKLDRSQTRWLDEQEG